MAESETTIAALTGDRVVYRDLQPCDPALPGLSELRDTLGIPAAMLPRKRDNAYARVIMALLNHAQSHRGADPLQTLLVLGDTENDRRMAAHLRTVSQLPVLAFIGVDQNDVPPQITWEDDTAEATRWAMLDAWHDQVKQRGHIGGTALDWSRVAFVIDIDKTLLGPRGRADTPINAARADGAFLVAQDVLGIGQPDRAAPRDETAFRELYATLCRSEYHSLTLDNQDYTVFVTLLVAGGALSLDELRQGMQDGSLADFTTLLQAVAPRLPAALRDLHAEVQAANAAGDPTPFKAFRHAEFAATVARMADGRLTFCREVVTTARTLIERGVLCLAASDKPSEASYPTPEQAATGLRPLHRTPAQIR